jgi:hypothetical protein
MDTRRITAPGWPLLLAAALALAAPAARAARPAPVEAHAGLELATAAARAWAADAALVYLENDEPLDEAGSATRWGYLFTSPSTGLSRLYSVRAGRILAAENLAMKLEAPPVTGGWLDSGAALAAAEEKAGRAFRSKHGGRLATMLLMRGAFDEARPDRTTWTLVYTAPGQPSLWVVVDAADGGVVRTWRG